MKKRDSKSLFMLLVMAFGLLLTTVGYAQKKGLYDVKTRQPFPERSIDQNFHSMWVLFCV